MNQSMEMEIVETLAIPKLMLSVIPVPKQLIKEQKLNILQFYIEWER